jgi:hypothetical protein
MIDLPHDLRRLEAESIYIFREVVRFLQQCRVLG